MEPEEIAIQKVLVYSGLFMREVNGHKYGDDDQLYPFASQVFIVPTADQSEALLAKMGLQVAHNAPGDAEYFELGSFRDIPNKEGGFTEKITVWDSVANFRSSGSLTQILNAALAWCCENMKPELELAVNGEK